MVAFLTHDFNTPLATGDALAVDVLYGIAGIFVVSEPHESKARWVAGDPHLIFLVFFVFAMDAERVW